MGLRCGGLGIRVEGFELRGEGLRSHGETRFEWAGGSGAGLRVDHQHESFRKAGALRESRVFTGV